MFTFSGERFKVKIDAPFKCDNPLFDFYDAALDCYNKAVDLMIRCNHHNVKISIVKIVSNDELVLLETFIR